MLGPLGCLRMTSDDTNDIGFLREHSGTLRNIWVDSSMIRSVDFPRCEFFNLQQRWKRCEMATVSSVIFAGAHKYLQSFRMSIQYPRNICDVWKKKSVYSHHTSLTLNNISTHVPTRRLNVRTDWCVRLPCIIVDPRNYFRSFRMCIYHLLNVCDVWKKFSPFPSYLADPYQRQHVPTRRLGVANRLVRMATMHNCRPV